MAPTGASSETGTLSWCVPVVSQGSCTARITLTTSPCRCFPPDPLFPMALDQARTGSWHDQGSGWELIAASGWRGSLWTAHHIHHRASPRATPPQALQPWAAHPGSPPASSGLDGQAAWGHWSTDSPLCGYGTSASLKTQIPVLLVPEPFPPLGWGQRTDFGVQKTTVPSHGPATLCCVESPA